MVLSLIRFVHSLFMSSSLKKILFAVVLVAAFGGYVLYQRSQNIPSASAIATNNTPGAGGSGTPPQTEPNNPTSGTQLGTTTTTAANSTETVSYKDGEYTGPVTNAFFGNVQVKAVIKNGKLTDVVVLEAPNDRAMTIKITNDSMPKLKEEAIVAQSAKIDIISGATQTSEAYRDSLAAALAQAKV